MCLRERLGLLAVGVATSPSGSAAHCLLRRMPGSPDAPVRPLYVRLFGLLANTQQNNGVDRQFDERTAANDRKPREAWMTPTLVITAHDLREVGHLQSARDVTLHEADLSSLGQQVSDLASLRGAVSAGRPR